ncbi:phage integrase central domain-containing protein [Sphingomonas palmae]|uniref:phage integrase central domain-containing protein n=1 Tax=Sphingomonas palmae TaxID=1855283 RepID=UPI003CCB8603
MWNVLQVLQPLWQRTPETAERLRGRIENVLDAAKAKGCGRAIIRLAGAATWINRYPNGSSLVVATTQRCRMRPCPSS